MLEKKTHLNLLYDFYHSLLTDKQRQYMELYYYDDLSLGEIAEEFQVSRQAVYEHLKRAEELLHKYESQLQLVAKYEQRQQLLKRMGAILEESSPDLEELKRLVSALKNVD
ncbi:UPF0122 protein [Caldalkalibacillus thermarum TA2.A1]|uniref:UPF0122 protein CathTA2_1875 n=1 Tax=Caldalkalibacillus thermarum (strain TA2.A1) TaxID=986075 RepID=F5L7S7_CALTT|nr:putative DNA-binding protein [Caldalkalibacillus thermarum]EGL82584.1 UPF0122 protein [Caldalkalibacillus thermarum TA2.A1]QZT32820.1 putative DNA-binding protein [Caldalkalibacillus thermarum TA2.A1]